MKIISFIRGVKKEQTFSACFVNNAWGASSLKITSNNVDIVAAKKPLKLVLRTSGVADAAATLTKRILARLKWALILSGKTRLACLFPSFALRLRSPGDREIKEMLSPEQMAARATSSSTYKAVGSIVIYL